MKSSEDGIRLSAALGPRESALAVSVGPVGAGRRRTSVAAHWACAAVAALVSGCGSTSNGSGMLDQTVGVIGLQRAQPPQLPSQDNALDAIPKSVSAQPRKITLRLHAGDVLNTDASGRSLSVVTRIYKLRDKVAFEEAPYADFEQLKPAKAPEFSVDVVAVREIVLTPGKRYDVIESVGSDAPYLAVVALFRAPSPQRWRFVFDAKAASVTGVTLGLHACAMSVAAGQAVDVAPETVRVAGVICPDQ